MNPMFCCVAPLLVLAPAITTSPLSTAPTAVPSASSPVRTADTGLIALGAHEDASLLGMRAGAPATSALDTLQRDTLAQAQASAPDLASMRAGELTNSDLVTVAIVVLVIVVIAILI